MTAHAEPRPIPRPLLWGAGGLLAAAVAAAAIGRLAPEAPPIAADARIEASALITVRDEADGAVGVYDAASGAPIEVYGSGEGGFVRAALRAAAFDRKRADLDADAPFRLTRTGRGRLVLEDTLTGRSVGLEAFGRDNEGDFAKLLDRTGGAG